MRILLITSSFPVKHHVAGVHLPDLIEEFLKLDCQVHVLTQNCLENAVRREKIATGYEVTYFRWQGGFKPLVSVMQSGVRGYLGAFRYLANGVQTGLKVVREWKPDIILAEWIIPAGMIAVILSRLTGVPYATRSLGSDVMLAEKNKVANFISRFICRRASALFADGFDLCAKTSALTDGRPCQYAATSRHLSFERGEFHPLDDDGWFTTCTVGRLHPTKGQDVLLQAVAALNSRGIKIRSYIVGTGEEERSLSRTISDAGMQQSAILTGRLEDGDIADLLTHVDCVVIPSRNESIPLVLGEAVRAGKPVIVTDVGDMGTLVRDYSLGLVVPPEDPAALAEAMSAMEQMKDRSNFSLNRERVTELLGTAGAARLIVETFGKHVG